MTLQFKGHFMCLLIIVLFAMGNYACLPKNKIQPTEYLPPSTTIPSPVCVDDDEHASSVEAFIANGRDTNLGELPHQVALFSVTGNDVICSGAILTPRLIITAAHCILNPSPRDLKVIAGLTDLTLLDDKNNKQKQAREVAFYYVPANYHVASLANDIAILVLDAPLVYNNNVRNINLPRARDSFEREVIVAGWGEMEDGSYPIQLKKAKLRTVRICKCKKFYNNAKFRVTVNHICVGKRGSGTCRGDSGGPVLCKRSGSAVRILCGIVSWGSSDMCGDRPGVCTRVASYTDWIKQAGHEVKTMDQTIEKIVRELVADGLNAKDYKGKTPLHRAAALEDKGFAVKIIKVLINMGADVWARYYTDNDDNYIFLSILFFKNSTITPIQFHDLATFLTSKELSALFNSRTKTLLYTAFQRAVVKLEIETRTLSLLKNNGVDFKTITFDGDSIIFSATSHNRTTRLISDLVSFGADPMHLYTFLNQSNLHKAVLNSNVELVKLFLGLGLDVNSQDKYGDTPLHDVIKSYSQSRTTYIFNIIQILMRNGANIFIANNKGKTPLGLFNNEQGGGNILDNIVFLCLLRGRSC